MPSGNGHGRRGMLFSSSLSKVREGAASPRARATGLPPLNAGTRPVRPSEAADRVPATPGVNGDLARNRRRASPPARVTPAAAACETRQAFEFHRKNAGPLSPVIAASGAVDGQGAMMSPIARRKIGDPSAVNAAVNQMDQVTPQNADRLIPTSRKGQLAPRAGQRSRRRGRGDL